MRKNIKPYKKSLIFISAKTACMFRLGNLKLACLTKSL